MIDISDIKEKMCNRIDTMKKEYGKLQTGRAHISLLDGIKVDYYGTQTPISQVASLSVPEPRTIVLQPWETSMIKNIERAIQKSEIDINPTNDGKIIRLVLPTMTEERRKLLVKKVKKMGEEYKIAIRNIRRDANDEAKREEKTKEISLDSYHSVLSETQKITDKYIEDINQIMLRKEKDIMEIGG